MSEPRSASSHAMTYAQVKAASQIFRAKLDQILDGNMSEMARRCGVTPQAVQAWSVSGVIPARRVVQVCNALDGEVAEYQLRPDIFRAPAGL